MRVSRSRSGQTPHKWIDAQLGRDDFNLENLHIAPRARGGAVRIELCKLLQQSPCVCPDLANAVREMIIIAAEIR